MTEDMTSLLVVIQLCSFCGRRLSMCDYHDGVHPLCVKMGNAAGTAKPVD